MDQLHASKTVASKITAKRQEAGWSMKELAERSGLSEDVIEAIENNRRRRGVTVDEMMILANALNNPAAGVITIAFTLLPPDSDYWPEEQRARMEADEQERKAKWEAEAPQREASWSALSKLVKEDLPKLSELFKKIPKGAVLAIEQDGKLVKIEDEDGNLITVK